MSYSFLGSNNWDKVSRYHKYFHDIFKNESGFIDGPGWPWCRDFQFNAKRDKYIYARTSVGINLHIEEQIKWPNELNERTYMLAACGVPQLIDNPGLLKYRFPADNLFVANNEKEYRALFSEIIHNPAEAKKRALKALNTVYKKHTTFHRLEKFILNLVESKIIDE